MEEVRGHHAIWRFDEESVRISAGSGRKVPALLKSLGQCSVPLAAVREVEFDPGDRKHGWRLRLRLVDGADPYAPLEPTSSATATSPLLLTGPHDRELVTEYFADRLADSARYAREVLERPLDLGRVAERLVARLPLQVRTAEGSASFDGHRLRLQWDGWMASTAKEREKSRDFPLSEIEHLEWNPPVDITEGFLRVVLRGVTIPEAAGLENDFFTLVSHGVKGSDETLLMAATVNTRVDPPLGAGSGPAAIAGGAPVEDSDAIFAKIRELGRLHAEGLLTDEEFGAKKAELLGRL